MKKCLALVMVLALAVCLFAGCGSTAEAPAAAAPEAAATGTFGGKDLNTETAKIAYIPISTAGVTNQMVKLAFDDALMPYNGNVIVDWFDCGYDTQTQITMVNDAVTQGYDLIMLESSDPVSLATPVAEAEAAGVPVITINLNADAPHTLQMTGVDYLAGKMAAETLINDFGADSAKKVIVIDCPAPMAATNLQAPGFIDYMTANSNWELLADQNVDNFSQEGANTATRDLLTKYDDVDIIFCIMDDLTTGVVQAVQAAGRDDGSIVIYGNMGNPSTWEMMTNGSGAIYGLNFLDYYGQYLIIMNQALYYIETGITAAKLGLDYTPETYVGCTPATPETAELYRTLSRWDLAVAAN